MAKLPKVTMADITRWYQMKEQLDALKLAEHNLRMRIFGDMFPTPEEGTNIVNLKDGTGAVLKAVHTIRRDVDAGALEAFGKAMREPGTNIPKVNLNKLIQWKPLLVVKEYRSLTEDECKFFDQCLIIKDGSPQLKIEIPKRSNA